MSKRLKKLHTVELSNSTLKEYLHPIHQVNQANPVLLRALGSILEQPVHY